MKYTNVNFDLPVVIQIWVDTDDDGNYDDGEKYDLFEIDSNDRDCPDGKVYQPLDYTGSFLIKYLFYAKDRYALADGDPAAENILTAIKGVPVLSWTAKTNYAIDGVDPDTGITGTSFILPSSFNTVRPKTRHRVLYSCGWTRTKMMITTISI